MKVGGSISGSEANVAGQALLSSPQLLGVLRKGLMHRHNFIDMMV